MGCLLRLFAEIERYLCHDMYSKLNVYYRVGSNQIMGEQTIKRKSKNDTEFECYD